MENIIDDYIEKHSTPENEILSRLNRETHLKVLRPIMLSGHIQGAFIQLFSRLLKPKNILEIGTFTGYSSICLAQGIREDGKLITIEKNAELEDMIRHYFGNADIDKKTELIIGDARDVIPTLNYSFDLVFLDADKQNYIQYYQLVKPLVNKGGFIIADNVLWYNKVADEKYRDRDTTAIREFNHMVQMDPEVTNLLLPLRDGIMIIEKI